MSKRDKKESGTLTYDRLPTISEVNESVKMGKLTVNKLVIDNFVKGIGVLATNTDTGKLLFIETRSFNPLKISIKNNLIKLDNLDKTEVLTQLSLDELIESYINLPEC